MELGAVLEGVPLRGGVSAALRGRAVQGLEYDSRRVGAGSLFVAFAGAKSDGRMFAAQAMEKGALAVMSEFAAPAGYAGPWIQVEHGRRALALACRNFYGPPERDLSLNGFTGTNGKTTSSLLLDSLFRKAGKTTGVFGTIGNTIAGEWEPAINTTPESLDLYRMFEKLRARGGTHVSMEVSSHALFLGRTHGLAFHTAVMTNLSQDHLDLHGTIEDYFAAKQQLFVSNGASAPRFAAINADDEWARRIRTESATQVLTYGLSEDASVRAEEITSGFEGLSFTLRHGGVSLPLRSALVGTINVYNILAACTAGIAHGLDVEMIAAGITECNAVPGRFERVDEGQPFLVIVDYAHTPDALRNAIAVARDLKPRRVITLFGCGGDRDRSKRPLMGMAAGELSDFVVLTSDNPRSEDPLNVINDALVGLRRFDTPHYVELDRAKAIRMAVDEAKEGDLILVAGKGHETYQVQKDQTIDFDDREETRRILREFGYRRNAG
ncbi:MAG: UDP-N-acetylmuramoyl-L-alanyl-D-glutamate--2,6-diaminopimelate ligase [Candidatus Solibacter usitatus]|nr:UDP-N-acetylmuramoyl-L-alanyl-D-glutamate--2,6-diaminopimelate ligase [Candidatus Solibacter usitatus]